MPYVAIVTVLALVEFMWFGALVGRARGKFGIPAPATTGNEVFERYFRVQMNTLEQLALFLPSLWIFASYVSPTWGAALGAIFLIGRAIYCSAYVRDPKGRSLGFALSVMPTLLMMLSIVIWAVRAIIVTAGVTK
jgi:hypothetical protein